MFKALILGAMTLLGAFAQANQVLQFQDTTGNLFEANINQTRIYMQLEECADKYVDLVQTYLKGKTVEVKYYNEVVTLDKSTLQFCGIDDLDQGSYNIDRAVSLCADVVGNADGKRSTATVFVKTNGDMFCDSEELTSFDGIWVH